MTSLAEVFDYNHVTNIPTYSEREGGFSYAYQVSITVRVNLNDALQRKLEAHFSQRRGYDSCECDRARNEVTICHLGGLRRQDVMGYIHHRVDSTATEVV